MTDSFMPYRPLALFTPYHPSIVCHMYREGHISDEDYKAFMLDTTGKFEPTIHKEPIYRKMEEKTFRYTQAVGAMNTIELEKKESELTENEIKLFYADILRAYLSAPKKAQEMFQNELSRRIREHFNDIANGRD